MIIFKEKPKTMITLIFILIVILFLIFLYLFNSYRNMDTQLPHNIWINENNMGGKNLCEIEKLLDELAEKHLNKKVSIVFSYQDFKEVYEFSLYELGFKSNKEEIEKQIDSILMSDASLLSRLKDYLTIQYRGMYFLLEYEINQDTLLKALEKFNQTVLPKSINASYDYKDGNLSIIDENIGYEFNKEQLCKDLKESNISTIHLQIKELIPTVTSKFLKEQGINEKISTFSTEFNSSNSSRSHNIKLASQSINGTILSPGAIFSFNSTLGKRTKDKGYKEAGVYLNGQVSEGLGGGICQVSTTLYNAVLLADLELVERNNHSLTVPYVPLSRDAAVSWGYQDFKFKNNTDHYIYIGARVKGNVLTFDLFGTKSNKEVELISTTLSQQSAPIIYQEDVTIQSDQKIVVDNGHNGYISSLVKNVYIEGKLISSEVVSKDKYLSSPKIIKKNTLYENIVE